MSDSEKYKWISNVPTQEMWSGLARDIVMWHDLYPPGKNTPRTLFNHLTNLGRVIPQWLKDEPEMKLLNHVPSKGTRAAIIFRAMWEDADGFDLQYGPTKREKELKSELDAMNTNYQALMEEHRKLKAQQPSEWNAAMEAAIKVCTDLRTTISDPAIIGFERADAGHNTLTNVIAHIRARMRPVTQDGEPVAQSALSPRCYAITIDKLNFGSRWHATARMFDSDAPDYYPRIVIRNTPESALAAMLEELGERPSPQQPSETAVRKKVVAELRSSAFLHCDVNKEDVLLSIEHGRDWPQFKRPAAQEADELKFNATRLRNVAKLVGLGSAVPQDDATLDDARGSVLGMIARALRNKAAQEAEKPPLRFTRKHGSELWLEGDGFALNLNVIADQRGPIVRKAMGAAIVRHLNLDAQEAAREQPLAHDLYEDEDENKPSAILDRNGQVVLGLCKRCGKAEAELEEPCIPREQPAKGEK